MTAQDRLDTWGVRIAERVAPKEKGFAAQTARAYAAGGTPRRNLFSSPGQAPGGMGGGAAAVLPAVLDGLAHAAGFLKSAMGSPELNNLLSATGLLVGLRAQRRAEAATRPAEDDTTASPDDGAPSGDDGAPSGTGAGDRNGGADSGDGGGDDGGELSGAPPGVSSGGAPGAVVPQGGADPTSAVPPGGADSASAVPPADVVRAALRMSARLRARGFAPDGADELTARLIARLLTEDDPVEAAAFLDALVGDEPPPPPRGPDDRRGKLRRLRSAASGLLHRAGHPRTTPHGPPTGPEGTGQG
ncbi:hypothetical protein [Streptomyces sp. NPDC058751]|uniref:hypothetical protein n=1 Tax=Streptomyces sp. NPDC058751 TaxID=3346623 RepID=UPI00368F209D